MKKFIRQDTSRLLRLGKKRKKLQKWRMPKGRHNKIRRKRFGYPLQPGIGFGTPKVRAGKISNLYPVLVHNLKELESLSKEKIAIIAKVGAKKKIVLLKRAEELGIKVNNFWGKKK